MVLAGCSGGSISSPTYVEGICQKAFIHPLHEKFLRRGVGEAFLKTGPPPHPLSKTSREENEKSPRQFSSTKTKRKNRRTNTFGRFLPQRYSILHSSFFILQLSLFTFHSSLFTLHVSLCTLHSSLLFCLPPGGRGTTKWWKEQAGAKVKHGALHDTIVIVLLYSPQGFHLTGFSGGAGPFPTVI